MIPSPLDNSHADEIAALLAVESERSFVGAGRLLHRDASVVSKRLSAMEERLGVRLIERSTRQVRMTEVATQLVSRLRAAIASIADAEMEAASGAAQIGGVLRIALPSAMGRLWLSPLLPEFLHAHPKVSIVADYSERFVDIIAEGFDLAIRIGELHDSRLIAQKLCNHRRILCAAPDYIETHGTPSTPEELVRHVCIRFSEFSTFPAWCLSNGARHERIEPKGSLTSNDAESLLAAANAGVGILGAGDWLMSRDIAAGRLVRILPEWILDAQAGVYIVRPSAKFASATTLAFKEWITSKFLDGPPWGVDQESITG